MTKRKWWQILILLIGTTLSFIGWGQENFVDNLEQIVANFDQDANIGIIIQSMQDGQILYAHNAQQLLAPASTLKLFTAYAALSYLGPDYRFRTQLLTDALYPVSTKNQLNGNLYIKFSGDPELKLAQLDQLLTPLNRTLIKGKVLIDDTAYDQNGFAPGWIWAEQKYCYAAPTTAMTFDHNCLSFNLIPAKHLGTLSQIVTFNYLLFTEIDNNVITQAKKASCSFNLQISENNHYSISGCIHRKPIGLAISINDPHGYGMHVIDYLLKKHQIVVAGNLSYAKSSSNLTLIAQQESLPLAILVKHMLKKSDNLIADSLFKKLGAEYFNTVGTWENGKKALKAILALKANIDLSTAVVYDGAGLSRYNLIAPRQFAQLLQAAYRDPALASLFIHAMPIAGIDGTLKYRLSKADTLGKVFAKTGTMKGISALSGYVQTLNNTMISFAIISNGYTGSAHKYHLLQDKICQYLVHSG